MEVQKNTGKIYHSNVDAPNTENDEQNVLNTGFPAWSNVGKVNIHCALISAIFD